MNENFDSSEKLYQITKQKPWSIEVKRRRLHWYGHMARLPEKTPTKRALREFQRYVRKPRGRTKTTWVETVEKDMNRVKVVVLDGGGKKDRQI